MLKRDSVLVYAVTDRTWLGENSLASQVEQAIQGGVTFVQLREKGRTKEEILAQAKEIKEVTDRYQVPFVINDNVEIALACNADGVHVGQQDMALVKARELLGPDKIIGVSARTVEQAMQAEKDGADYLGVGAVFGTSTKQDAKPLSHEIVREICEAVNIPVVAIGGICAENVKQLKGTWIDGVAVVSGIFAQPEIKLAAQELNKVVKEMIYGEKLGVIFDFDGTVVDSMKMWLELPKKFLSKKGYHITSEVENALITMNMVEACTYLKQYYHMSEDIKSMVTEIKEMVAGFYEYEVTEKVGIRPLLQYLWEQKIPMCIATAGDARLVEVSLKRLGLWEYFGKIFTCNEYETNKEEALIYEVARDYLGTKKNNTIVIEDAYHAMKTAKEAGFLVIGVYDESEMTKEEVIREQVDVYKKSMKEVEVYIRKGLFDEKGTNDCGIRL